MATRNNARPLPRSPKITADTPLLKSAAMRPATGQASSTGTAQTTSQDAVASVAASTGTSAPIPEDTISSVLTTALRDKILDAVKEIVELWRHQARFDNVSIMASNAIAGPNCLRGPRLLDLRNASMAYHQTQGLEREVMDMALRGISDNFQLWQYYVTIPALPLFPGFIAVPAPFAPPTAAVPMPLTVFVSGYASRITSATHLRSAMANGAPDGFDAPGVSSFCNNIGQCCAIGFQNFLASQIVRNLIGSGPVPTFAPPQAPIGPVMGGSAVSSAGILSASPAMSIPKLPLG